MLKNVDTTFPVFVDGYKNLAEGDLEFSSYRYCSHLSLAEYCKSEFQD